ncbi:PrsW family intramembrane metalloprotease [Nocardioides sp. WS12]|uniref:PrsW family intramembrane metalloprotease n=1 Tax=Nocardioides sp. WS12 TaxID=2486272 RepID=UPI0015F7902F|nr:PrsW family intramembrane metalloprotease [Nocardioides sp. WS12]
MSTDAATRQREALETSGWGEKFQLVQPRNLNFWVYLALTGVGLFQAWSFFGPSVGFYADAFAVGAVLCTACGAAWWLWLRHIDRWERQPAGLVTAALVWGAVASTFGFAMTVNTAMLSIYAKLFGQDWAANWAAGLTAPFTEESAKLCGFLLLMGLAPRLVRTANDGLVIGAFIGLGFATFENFLYAANSTANAFGTDPVGNAARISATRIGVSFVSHPFFSALVCCGVIYLIGTTAQPRRRAFGAGLVLLGMFFHFTWDDAAGLGGGNGAVLILVMAASAILGLSTLRYAFRQAAPCEHQFVRDILAPEVAAGVINDNELDSILDKAARKAYRKSSPHRKAKRAHKHLRRAILDLAHEIGASRGADTDDVARARAEVTRLRASAAGASS